MRPSRYWLVVALLFAILCIATFLVLQARLDAGKGLPEFSVLSGDENGLATAATVLRQLGFRPVALTRPIQHTQHQGLLLLIEPEQRTMLGISPGLGDKDAQGLLAWVARGNTLVLMTRTSTTLHQQLGVEVIAEGTKSTEERKVYLAEPTEVGGFIEPVDRYTVAVRALGVEGKDLVQGSDGVPLWYVGDKPGAWLVPHGDGRILVIADSSLWTHRGLVRQDNVLLLYNIARISAVDGRVFFDEYHHGIRSGGGYWDYFRYHRLNWLVLQVLAVVGVAAWSVAVRMGPPRPTPLASRTDAVDYAAAMARIYQRAGVQHLLAEHLVRDFMDALTRHLHLRRTTTPAEIVKTCKQRFGATTAHDLGNLLSVVARLREVQNPQWRFSRRELLRWSREFDAFVNRLSAAGSRRQQSASVPA